VGIELVRTERTVIEANLLHRNVEANVREEDTRETMLRSNLGLAGGYV
jgi:hypothetical protein